MKTKLIAVIDVLERHRCDAQKDVESLTEAIKTFNPQGVAGLAVQLDVKQARCQTISWVLGMLKEVTKEEPVA